MTTHDTRHSWGLPNSTIRVGTDLVSCARIRKSVANQAFLAKVFHPNEIDACLKKPNSEQWFAGRFAAKEAIAKALGTGFRGGITMPSITITKSSLNKPQVSLTGAAAERLRVIGAQQVLVSIADEVDSVVAFAIAQ